MRLIPHVARRPLALAALASLATLAACAGDPVSAPVSTAPLRSHVATPGNVRISELRYDHVGTDTAEAIEVTAAAGTNLTGWTLVRYNGSNNQPYTSPAQVTALGGPVAASCGAEGVQVVRFATDGLQNGERDGVALVDPTGHVVEFLSYEGTLTAAAGPAAGMTSTDVGVAQSNTTPVSMSIQRNGFGGWSLAEATFGACNDQPVTYDGPTTVVVSELMGDPVAALSASWGEWFEVHNHGAEPVNLGGWTIRSGGDAPHTIGTDVVIPAGGHVVLSRSDNVANNGGIAVDYNYFSGSATTIWLDASDWLVLRSPDGVTRDSVAWTALPRGATRMLRDASVENDDADGANWGYGVTPYGSGDFGTPGAPNRPIGDAAPPVPTGVARIVFSGRTAADPALPVGFEDQLFADTFLADGSEVTVGLTWSSDTPALASVDEDGVVRALGAGTAIIRVTTADGRVGRYALPTRVATPSTTAAYEGNEEFGRPTDADPADDVLIVRPTFTVSYSPWRNTPNWVSYDLEATHFGPEDRCDCFTADPLAPAVEGGLTTADYTGAGAFHGYGIDRGHLVRSADRTAGSLDNAHTFYFSNIVPQAADNNQGPWSALENFLGDQARTGTKEVYVVAGVWGDQGTVKDEGKVVIPESVWKVAVIMDRNEGLEDVDDAGDFQLVAVDMPNVAGIRSTPWQSFQVTVDSIERASGYDLLALLPDHVEWIVEAGHTSPTQLSAPRLLQLLAAGIDDLVARGVLADGVGNSLTAKLAAARQQLAQGNLNAATGQLRAFQNEVWALERSGRTTPAQAGSLTIFAGWIRAAIG